MIREWLADDGRVVRFDDSQNYIDYRNELNEVLDGPRPALDYEIADYRTRYPEAPVEELQRRSAMILALDNLISVLRAANADGKISSVEFANDSPKTIETFTKFSQYGSTDDEMTFKVLIAIINVLQSVIFMSGDLNTGLYGAVTQSANVRTDLDTLIAKLTANGTIS